MRWMKFKLKNNNHWVTFSTKSIPPTQHTPPPCRKRCMNYKFIGVFVSVFPQLRDADNGIRTFFGVINQFSFVRNDLHASGTCRIACTLFVRLRICKLGMHSKLQLWRPNDAYLLAIFSTMGIQSPYGTHVQNDWAARLQSDWSGRPLIFHFMYPHRKGAVGFRWLRCLLVYGRIPKIPFDQSAHEVHIRSTEEKKTVLLKFSPTVSSPRALITEIATIYKWVICYQVHTRHKSRHVASIHRRSSGWLLPMPGKV